MGIDNKPPELGKGKTPEGKVERVFRLIGTNVIFALFVWGTWSFFKDLLTIIGILSALIFVNCAVDKKLRDSFRDSFMDSMSDIFSD